MPLRALTDCWCADVASPSTLNWMHHPQSHLHLREVFQKISNIEEAVRSARAVTRASGLQKYLETIDRIAGLLEQALRSETNAVTGDVDIEEIASRYDLAVRDLHRDAFELTSTELVHFYPSELLPAIAHEVSRSGVSASLVLHPYEGNSYETRIFQSLDTEYLDFISPEGAGETAGEDEPDWFVFFSYPKSEAKNVLLHLIMLSHEVMHLREIRHKLVDQVISDIQVTIETQAVQDAVQQIASAPVDQSDALLIPRTVGELYKLEHLQSLVVAESNAVIASWLREIVCDMLATRLYGPAYLCAFTSLSRTLGIFNSFSNSHPSSYFRVRFILQELANLGYATKSFKFSHYRELITYWKGRLKAEETEPAISVHRIAREKILESVDAIRKTVRKDSAGHELRMKDLNGELEGLLAYLRHGIPPGQVLMPTGEFSKVRFSAIMNAAWYFYISEIDTMATLISASAEPSEPRPLTKLNELAFKALDVSQCLET